MGQINLIKGKFSRTFSYIHDKGSKIISMHRCFKINLNDFLVAFRCIKYVAAKKTKLIMMCHPVPDSYKECYNVLNSYSYTMKMCYCFIIVGIKPFICNNKCFKL